MSSSDSSSPDEDNFHNICYLMGLALATWQKIEDVHFRIYCRLLDVPMHKMASVAYYSIESFHARRRMVSGMAAYFLQQEKFKNLQGQWQKLDKRLKDANDNRNKFAHYALDYDIASIKENADKTVTVEYTPHRLRPAQLDYASRLLGRTADKEEHNLGPKQIKQYIAEFRQLAGELQTFFVRIGQNPAETPQGIAPSPETPHPHHPSPETPQPKDEPPSDQ